MRECLSELVKHTSPNRRSSLRNSIFVLALSASLLTTPAQASDPGEGLELAQIARETEDADANASELAAKNAAAEEQKLQKEIAAVEQEMQAIKEAKERVKEQALQTQKRIQALAARSAETRKRLAQMNKEKQAEEKQLEDAKQKLLAAETDDKTLQEDTRKLEVFMKMAQDERKGIFDRIQRLKARIAQEQQRLQSSQAQYNQYRQKNKEYETRVTTAENRRPASVVERPAAGH